MSKLIVTGGAGFIGSHLVDRLIDLGHEVVIVDNLMLGKKEFINKKAEFHQVDIKDLKKIETIFSGAEAVFHLAADPRLPVSINDPLSTHEINVTGTLNVLLAAKKNNLKKVIFSSSCAVYGNQTLLPIKESTLPNPLSPYGLHKLIGEQYCRLFSSLYGLPTVCLRYFNVFGPRKLSEGSYPMVIPVFLDQRKKGEKLTIVGDGTSTRDYIHVSDVVEANILAWSQNKLGDGSPINIGYGKQTSVNEIAALVGGEAVNLPVRSGEIKSIEADISLARSILGWKPTVDVAEGVLSLKKAAGL
ncbi:MAG TPA: NAD-dependent epimerase/dehydratase family protein [Candidatus Udaeobacter sp.]|nr:NAD-dependent epimerase/dehydratase family protein [Candidatus Udaeobacter sp.]